MEGITIVDIGELGWSLYLSAFARWNKKRGFKVEIITSPDRMCLYEGIADFIKEVPKDFYERFSSYERECSGLYRVPEKRLRDFFNPLLKYPYAEGFRFSRCVRFFRGREIYEPYKVKEKYTTKRILVFPRCRKHRAYSFRNLPAEFYSYLIDALCRKFPLCIVTALGTIDGAYNINLEQKRPNYENLVGKTESLQIIIDMSAVAVGAVGGTSAPPKITLLQGVPTYIIGHERVRFTKTDNWMKTRVGFWNVRRRQYQDINIEKCVKDVVRFLKND